MDRTPEIDVVLLESGDTPTGMGEPPIGPVAAAVGNAFGSSHAVQTSCGCAASLPFHMVPEE